MVTLKGLDIGLTSSFAMSIGLKALPHYKFVVLHVQTEGTENSGPHTLNYFLMFILQNIIVSYPVQSSPARHLITT